MRSTPLFIVTLALLGAALSARPLIPLDSASDHIITLAPFPARIAAFGNIALAGSSIDDNVQLFRRNSDGFYVKKSSVSLPDSPFEISTDGNWIAVSIFNEYKSFLYKIDENDQISYSEYIPSEFDAASLIAPNTLLVVNTTHLKTYEHDGTEWLLVDESEYGTPAQLWWFSGKEIYRATENSFIGSYYYQSNYYGFIMQRRADKSWVLFDQYNITSPDYDPSLSVWNGDDTVVVAIGDASVISVHKREGPGQWSQKFINSWQMGYTVQANFGHAAHVLDSNNILIAAPYHSFIGSGASGAVVLMHRDSADAEWEFSLDFGRFSSRAVQFGFGLTANEHDILMFSCSMPPEGSSAFNCSFFTHPACFVEPIDVTCPSGPTELDQCNSLMIADVAYVNNPQCGQVTQSLPEFRWSAEGVAFNVTFSRAFVPDVTCALTLTCPVLPAAPMNSPTTTPGSSSVPVATGPSAKVNDAPETVVLDAIAFVGIACASFLLI